MSTRTNTHQNNKIIYTAGGVGAEVRLPTTPLLCRYFNSQVRANGYDTCGAPRGCMPDELLHPGLSIPALALTDPAAYWVRRVDARSRVCVHMCVRVFVDGLYIRKCARVYSMRNLQLGVWICCRVTSMC